MKLLKHFDFSKDIELDKTSWNVEVGEKWANNEFQHYVDKKENLFFKDGLVINGTFKNGVYESSRINTKGKFFFKYGRIDVIAKVPSGKGTWPAVWMMPEESKYGHWPRSGEIDILEHIGNDIDNAFLCLHTKTHNHRNRRNLQYHTDYTLTGMTENFHTYSIDWNENSITYIIDDLEIVKYTKGQPGYDPSPAGWPFDENFYIILNLALGGGKGGPIDNDSFPQQFIIKDIKIFQ